MWNLPPPPGFQGLHPHKPLTVYVRHLPHWRQEGATYFVTFRLAGSLPQSKLDELAAVREEWGRRHSFRGVQIARTALESRPTEENVAMRIALEELARETQQRVESWLDQGMGSCLLKQPALASYLTTPMHHFDEAHYELGCYVVMPNHAHAIIRPLGAMSLEDLVGNWKKYSSRRINCALKTAGQIWQDESYDRIIRDEEHLWRAIQYIGSNADRAGLPRESCPLWIRPQWIALGWRFEEYAARTAQESRPTRQRQRF